MICTAPTGKKRYRFSLYLCFGIAPEFCRGRCGSAFCKGRCENIYRTCRQKMRPAAAERPRRAHLLLTVAAPSGNLCRRPAAQQQPTKSQPSLSSFFGSALLSHRAWQLVQLPLQPSPCQPPCLAIQAIRATNTAAKTRRTSTLFNDMTGTSHSVGLIFSNWDCHSIIVYPGRGKIRFEPAAPPLNGAAALQLL